MGYRVGEFAGPYEVLQLLGRGTFGEVFVARDPRQPDIKVALKTVACDQLVGDVAERARNGALAEAQLLIRLRHPNIVRCMEVQWQAERSIVWLALELMDGGDAQSLIDRRREGGKPAFEAHFVRRVLAAVGSALRYIHAEGVLHRDVKPANVLLARRTARIKLGDFGISKLLEATGKARTVVGTPYYLAPEIVSGQAYGAEADAWALGICIYELVALRRPFEAGNPLALVRRICEEPPLPLPEDTSPDLSSAILGLLTKDVEERMLLTDALTVSDAVAVLADLPASACPSSLLQCEVSSLSPRDALYQHCSFEQSMVVPVASEQLSPVSAVSMATSESGCSNSPCQDEIVASLCGPLIRQPIERTLKPGGLDSLEPSSGLSSELAQGLAQARTVLASEVDDPEDLQTALRLLEEQPLPCSATLAEAVEAVRSEVRVRLAALRTDATTLLETILKPEALQPVPPAVACPPGWQVVRPPAASPAEATPDHAELARREESVVTCISNDGLETAIELATSMGIDTEVAEEQAAADRGLLSLKITWGAIARFCLLPVGVSFTLLREEVVRRFRLKADSVGRSDTPTFRLYFRDGGEVIKLRDQASWDACLHSKRLHSRPGRLELQLEVPFVITGTRVPSTLHNHGVGPDIPISNQIASADGASSATPAMRGARPRAALERHGCRGRVALQKASGAPPALPPRQIRGQGRRAVGSSATPLHLEGRAAAGRCIGASRVTAP